MNIGMSQNRHRYKIPYLLQKASGHQGQTVRLMRNGPGHNLALRPNQLRKHPGHTKCRNLKKDPVLLRLLIITRMNTNHFTTLSVHHQGLDTQVEADPDTKHPESEKPRQVRHQITTTLQDNIPEEGLENHPSKHGHLVTTHKHHSIQAETTTPKSNRTKQISSTHGNEKMHTKCWKTSHMVIANTPGTRAVFSTTKEHVKLAATVSHAHSDMTVLAISKTTTTRTAMRWKK